MLARVEIIDIFDISLATATAKEVHMIVRFLSCIISLVTAHSRSLHFY
jgi:hypothetical protein